MKANTESTITVEKLEKYLVDRLKNSNSKNNFGLKECPPRMLTWEEANDYCGVSKEEYEQSTRLYQIGFTITGKGGWDMFWESVREQCKTFS